VAVRGSHHPPGAKAIGCAPRIMTPPVGNLGRGSSALASRKPAPPGKKEKPAMRVQRGATPSGFEFRELLEKELNGWRSMGGTRTSGGSPRESDPSAATRLPPHDSERQALSARRPPELVSLVCSCVHLVVDLLLPEGGFFQCCIPAKAACASGQSPPKSPSTEGASCLPSARFVASSARRAESQRGLGRRCASGCIRGSISSLWASFGR
jgi:hypothetical protein